MELLDPPPFSTLHLPTSKVPRVLGLLQTMERESAEATDVTPRPVTRVSKEVDRHEPDKATHGVAHGEGGGQDCDGAHHSKQE